MEQKQKTIVKILVRLLVTVAFIAVFSWLCLHLMTIINRKGLMASIINGPHFEVYVFSIGGGLLGLVAFLLSLIWGARRDVTFISLAAFILFMLPLGWVKTKEWFTVGRFDTISMVEDLTLFRPFTEKNILVKLDKPLEKRMEGKQPRIDGVMNMFRFYSSIVENVCRKDGWMAESETAGTALGRLFTDEADVVFCGLPPQSVAAKASSQGKELETTLVVKEAFVFYVNADNTVDNLSLEQIKQIYGGKTTDWKDVGSQKGGSIEAFQRMNDSENQTVFRKITENCPLMEPPSMEKYVNGGFIHSPADYRNSRNAIGYSYRSQAADLLLKKKIKLLAIDGVAPTPENILNGAYPYVTDYYMVTIKDSRAEEVEKNIRNLREFIFSPLGKELAEKCGLIPMRNE
ncbi:MAG: substrate-binding domain-containing protein [Lentisphaeria bacterium]|nr:substrate-binding domain-containing protein [Lentisphaeria bacterium]